MTSSQTARLSLGLVTVLGSLVFGFIVLRRAHQPTWPMLLPIAIVIPGIPPL